MHESHRKWMWVCMERHKDIMNFFFFKTANTQTAPSHKHKLKQASQSLPWTDGHDEQRIKLIHSWGRHRNPIKELTLSNEKTQCVHAHESVHVRGSTKTGSEKEKREMPSEWEAWEARCHIILEEMHRQQRGTRCNTLMNKYAEGWNWSLVLSGGGKKTRMNRGLAIWWVISKYGKILERRFLLSVMTLCSFLPVLSNYCLFLLYLSACYITVLKYELYSDSSCVLLYISLLFYSLP